MQWGEGVSLTNSSNADNCRWVLLSRLGDSAKLVDLWMQEFILCWDNPSEASMMGDAQLFVFVWVNFRLIT